MMFIFVFIIVLITFVFLIIVHELAHCLSPQVQVRVKRHWYNDHHNFFWNKYLELMRKAYELKIHDRKDLLSLRKLRRVGSINISDKETVF